MLMTDIDPQPRTVGGVRAGSAGFIYGIGAAGAKLLARRGVHARRSQPGDWWGGKLHKIAVSAGFSPSLYCRANAPGDFHPAII